jgi:hypothetical protein
MFNPEENTKIDRLSWASGWSSLIDVNFSFEFVSMMFSPEVILSNHP